MDPFTLSVFEVACSELSNSVHGHSSVIFPIGWQRKTHYVGNEVCMGCNLDTNLRGFPISGWLCYALLVMIQTRPLESAKGILVAPYTRCALFCEPHFI